MPHHYTATDVTEYIASFPQDIFEGDINDVIDDIQTRINLARQITSLSEAELLQGLDFQPKNYDVEKLESFLAELRSIFWMKKFGFRNIKPLPKKKKHKNPDFTAEIGKWKAVIEVFCITRKHQQQTDPNLLVYVNSMEKLEKAVTEAVTKRKPSQISALPADIRVLLCVINSEPINRLHKHDDFLSVIEKIHNNLNLEKTYFLGLLTGLVDLHTGKVDDCVYPPLLQ